LFALSAGGLLLIGVAGLAATAADRPGAGDDAGRPLLVLSGPQAAAEEPGVWLCSSQEVLGETWQAMMPEGALPDPTNVGVPVVDFDTCEAILIAGGAGRNASGYRVVEVLEDDGAVTVRIQRASYQTAGPGGGGVDVSPWALVLIPRTDKTIVVEEDTHRLKDEPPNWVERAAFPGLIGVGRPVEGTRQRGAR
jgi:hypothetical protein